MSKRVNKGKKSDDIIVDEKRGHLYLGDKDLRLIMLRPIDLVELSEFAGTNAADILIWVGKNISSIICEKIIFGDDVKNDSLSEKKLIINDVLDTFEHLGYGSLITKFGRNKITIIAADPLSGEEKGNIMAKNICIFYQGVFNGVLEYIGIDILQGEETQCKLLGDHACVFEFTLLVDEFSEEDIDNEREKAENVRDFLGTL
jgi:predicted hydrocarbon binding protein